MKQKILFSAIVVWLVIIGYTQELETTDDFKKQDWSPSRGFASRLRDKYITLASDSDSDTYASIYKHLIGARPGQVKDIYVCLFKYYTYSSATRRPADTRTSTFIRLLANMNQPLVNADDSLSYRACQIDDDFGDAFVLAFDVDIEEVLAGKHLPNVVSRMLEMGTNTYFYRPFYALLKMLKIMKAIIDPSIRLPNIEPASGSLFKPRSIKMVEHPWSGFVESNYLKKHYVSMELAALYEMPMVTKDGLYTIKLGKLLDYFEGFRWHTEQGVIPNVDEFSLQEMARESPELIINNAEYYTTNLTQILGKEIPELSKYLKYFADYLPSRLK